MAVSRTAALVLVTASLALLGARDTEAGPRRARTPRTRSVRMTSAENTSAPRAQGRLTFTTRRGMTYVRGAFTRLTPETTHTVRWGESGAAGPQFVTDRRGRAKIRVTALSEDSGADEHHFSLVDESGDEVLAHDDAHHGETGMHDDGHMDGVDHNAHHDDPAHHDDATMHDDGHMDGADHDAHHGGDAAGASDTSGTSGDDHASHHDGTSTGGGMHGGGSSGAGSMHGSGTSGSMHGGGMMKR